MSQLKLIMEGNISKAKNLDGITLEGTLDSGGGDVDDENQCSRTGRKLDIHSIVQSNVCSKNISTKGLQ